MSNKTAMEPAVKLGLLLIAGLLLSTILAVVVLTVSHQDGQPAAAHHTSVVAKGHR